MNNDNGRDASKDARRWLGRALDELTEGEQRALNKVALREASARDPNLAFAERLTFGERLADKVAAFGGSWTFLMAFGGFLVAWTSLNLLLPREAFDPYPFIFLNLVLSMIAAVQAPVIMMSQNRQAAKDRLNAAHDYEVNLKAEIEILSLHDKLDAMRARELELLIKQQEEQIALLTKLLRLNGESASAKSPRPSND